VHAQSEPTAAAYPSPLEIGSSSACAYGAFVSRARAPLRPGFAHPVLSPVSNAPWETSGAKHMADPRSIAQPRDALGTVDVAKERELHTKALKSRQLALQNSKDRCVMPSVGGLAEFRPPHSEVEWQAIEKALKSQAAKPVPWATEAAGMHEIEGGGAIRQAPAQKVDWDYYGSSLRPEYGAKPKKEE